MNFPDNHVGTLFKHCHFESSPIIVCIRWCITSKLSYRDLVAIMAERNVDVAYPTLLRWVQRSVPACEKRWQRSARPVGTSWRVDATYLKVKGQWGYLSRAVDSAGQTVDFLLSAQRESAAAKHFFEHTIEKRRAPEKITLDGYAASHGAVAELQDEGVLLPRLLVRTNRYVHKLIEQDHRKVKQRVRPMLGFKCFAQAAITLSGIARVHQIKKGQCDMSAFRAARPRTSQLWESVLAA